MRNTKKRFGGARRGCKFCNDVEFRSYQLDSHSSDKYDSDHSCKAWNCRDTLCQQEIACDLFLELPFLFQDAQDKRKSPGRFSDTCPQPCVSWFCSTCEMAALKLYDLGLKV